MVSLRNFMYICTQKGKVICVRQVLLPIESKG